MVGRTGCRAGRGERSCAPCADRTAALLRELAGLHTDGQELLTPARRWTPERTRGGSRGGGIVLDDAVVALRAEILDVLAAWTAGLTRGSGRTVPRRRVPELVDELVRLADRWPSCVMADRLDELAGRTRAALDPDRSTDDGLGCCVRPGCSEPLRFAGGDTPGVACAAGHVWEPHQWIALAARTGARADTAVRDGRRRSA